MHGHALCTTQHVCFLSGITPHQKQPSRELSGVKGFKSTSAQQGFKAPKMTVHSCKLTLHLHVSTATFQEITPATDTTPKANSHGVCALDKLYPIKHHCGMCHKWLHWHSRKISPPDSPVNQGTWVLQGDSMFHVTPKFHPTCNRNLDGFCPVF